MAAYVAHINQEAWVCGFLVIFFTVTQFISVLLLSADRGDT